MSESTKHYPAPWVANLEDAPEFSSIEILIDTEFGGSYPMIRDQAIALLSTARGIDDANALLSSIENVTLEYCASSMWCAEPQNPTNSHIGIFVDLDDDDTLTYDCIVTDSSEALETWKAKFDEAEEDFEEEPIGAATPDEIERDLMSDLEPDS